MGGGSMSEDFLTSWNDFENYLVETRYGIRGEDGNPIEKTIHETFKRITEHLPEEIKNAILDRYIIPATPFLMSRNSPSKRKGYFSCYPLGNVGDSMDEIMEIINNMKTIYLYGGGCGIDISRLRPKGCVVDNAQGVSSGPVGFLQLFDAVAGSISQGGRRRGALLVQMDWDHPDIELFIKAKAAAGSIARFIAQMPEEERPDQNPVLSNMNISINCYENFWKEERLIDLIAKQMWQSGDPGLLFKDNMAFSPFRLEDEPYYSNPCGEYLAPAFSACNLITVNVAKLAYEANQDRKFNFDNFFESVFRMGVIACNLGNIILDMEEGYPPIGKIKENTKRIRPVGVGLSGFHTALLLAYDFEVRYGDDKAVKFAELTQAALTIGTMVASAKKVKKNSGSDVYIWHEPYVKQHLEELKQITKELPGEISAGFSAIIKTFDDYGGLYNSCTTSQPPTGSVSQFLHIIDTGIEPFFAPVVKRRVRDLEKGWVEFELTTEYLDLDKEKLKKLETQTAVNLTPEEQLRMLQAFQKFVHTGVSKTINLPEAATVEDIKELIKKAKDMRLKGFTVYRNGSRDAVLTIPTATLPQGGDELPPIRTAKVYEIKGPVNAYVTISKTEKGIREVFVNIGKAGTTINSLLQAFGRIISVSLRRFPELAERYAETLMGIESGEFYNCDSIHGNSLPDILAKIIASELKAEAKATGDLCPSCGKLAIYRSGGCKTCKNCGYTTC